MESAQECVTTDLTKRAAPKMNGARACLKTQLDPLKNENENSNASKLRLNEKKTQKRKFHENRKTKNAKNATCVFRHVLMVPRSAKLQLSHSSPATTKMTKKRRHNGQTVETRAAKKHQTELKKTTEQNF